MNGSAVPTAAWTVLRRSAPLVLALFLALFAGCAPVYGDAFLDAYTAGARAYHAGRYQEAAAAYDRAAGAALRLKDRDEARFLEARTLQRAERWPEARKAYERLIAESPSGPRTGRALFDIADLEIEHGDAELGYRLLEDAARKLPGHGSARKAVDLLIKHAIDQGGEPAGLAWIEGRRAAFKGTDLDQVIDYQLAHALLRNGREQEARDLFVATARAHPYPFGGLTDDALWNAALLDEKAGRFQGALADLRALLAPREASDTMGSYERPRYSPAQLKIAEIYRDDLKDDASARRELHALYRDHKTSILRASALWEEARLARADGDAAAACSLVRTLTQEFAESRYVACARELCPSAPAAGGKECAPYLVRQVRGEPISGD